ncbi:hypothetical protein [Catellatospora sp. NPDC049609]|uniref:hypothetical protein n=1 Tax=Catellatospora sp. NPDC049609 TaxID=3155505 RepID=UPI0034411EDE
MTSASIGARSSAFLAEHSATFAQALITATDAAAGGRLRDAALAAERLRDGGRHLFKAVLRDALDAGMDWWALGDMVSLHPQAAWEQYGRLAEVPAPAPARQRPHLAITFTAGLTRVHEQSPEYGVEVSEVGYPYGFAFDPTVERIRAAAGVLGEDVWIAVTLPDATEPPVAPVDGVDVIKQWTSVLADDDAVVWLREVLDAHAAMHVTAEDLAVS